MEQKISAEINQPTPEHSTDKLPSAVTFFLQAKQRRSVLNALSAYSNNRSEAILIALGLIDSQ